jgi:phytoene/squalene synthetase
LDLELKQYPDMKALEDHAERSCGSLMQLILESDGVREEDYPVSHEAAKLLGKAHGLTNALRTSIPVMSTTGKLVIPQELCTKYGVRTPRYLLSALGQGDVECIQALRMAVQDISNRALDYLQQARDLRPKIQHEAGDATTKSKDIMGVFLPGLASETFLKRLQHHNFDLTNRNLRNVSALEHARCSIRMIYASWSQQY